MICVRRNANRPVKYGMPCMVVGVLHLMITFFYLCNVTWLLFSNREAESIWKNLYLQLVYLWETAIYILSYVLLLRKTIVSATIYDKIWELIALAEPYNIWQNIYSILAYIIDILIAALLITGSYTGQTYTALIWLISVTPFFIIATVYAVVYGVEEEVDQIILNTFSVAFIWISWYIVMKFYLGNKQKSKRKR